MMMGTPESTPHAKKTRKPPGQRQKRLAKIPGGYRKIIQLAQV